MIYDDLCLHRECSPSTDDGSPGLSFFIWMLFQLMQLEGPWNQILGCVRLIICVLNPYPL